MIFELCQDLVNPYTVKKYQNINTRVKTIFQKKKFDLIFNSKIYGYFNEFERVFGLQRVLWGRKWHPEMCEHQFKSQPLEKFQPQLITT